MRRTGTLLALLVGSLALASCAVAPAGSRPHRGYGPPPHAPAYGHRQPHSPGVELVFDSGLGVYVVVDSPGYFYYDGLFLRLEDNSWQASVTLEGPWESRSVDSIPPGLRKKGHTEEGGHPGRGKGAAKHAW